MTTELNPLDRADCDPKMLAFVEDAARQISADANGKQFLFVGDTDHRTAGNHMFLFSRVLMSALQSLGVKHIMLEVSRSKQVFVDAVVEGRLNPTQYGRTVGVIGNRIHGDDRANFEIGLYTGAGIQAANELGIRVHCVDGQEGMLRSGTETKYYYQQKRLTTAWLDYVLKTPRFFDDPKTLVIEQIEREATNFLRKHRIDLKAHAASGQFSPRQLIFQIWVVQNEGKLFQDVKYLMRKDHSLEGLTKLGPEDFAAMLDRRLKADRQLFENINNIGNGEKMAIFYGIGHIRYLGGELAPNLTLANGGGLIQSLAPDQYAVVLPFFNPDPVEHIKSLKSACSPDDTLIFIPQMKISKFGDLLSPDDKFRSSPTQQTLPTGRPAPN